MSVARWTARAALVVAVLWSGYAAAELPTEKTLAIIDRTFVCPEDLPNDETRDAANAFFLQLVMSMGEVTPEQLIEYRVRMLRRHNCTKSLENISKR